MKNKFVVIDLETTGNSPKKGDKIIQFGAVVIENGKITDRFSSLINPKINIPIFIEELTGITNEMVAEAPCFDEIAHKIQALLNDAYFVAHNVLFDLSFLQEELLRVNEEGFLGSVIDTVELSRVLLPTLDSYKLNDLANHLGFSHDRPHQADSDAEVTANIFLFLIERLNSIPITTFKQLYELSGGLKSDIQLLLEELFDDKIGQLEDWENELEKVNGLMLNKQLSEMEEDSTCVAPVFPINDRQKEEQLKRSIPFFQKRDGQLLMMNKIFEAFSREHNLVLEAGTGIGKSLGYLFPAAYFSKLSNKQVVISTYTTHLQSQLLEKDIPLLKQTLPFGINVALLKGKSHYISLSRFEDSLQDFEDNYDSCLTKMQILIWLLETQSGDVDELNLSSGGHIFWNRVCHSHSSKNKSAAWDNKDFYMRAKKKVKTADLIITNHSLLLQDVKEPSLLPPIQYLIVDEGHHFPRVAQKTLGFQIDYFNIRFLLNQFGQIEQKQLLFKLERFFNTKQILFNFGELNKLVTDLYFEMDEFFKAIRFYVKKHTKEDTSFSKVNQQIHFQESDYRILFHSAERFYFKLKEMIHSISNIISVMEELSLAFESEIYLYEETIKCFQQLNQNTQQFVSIFLRPDNARTAWIEIDFRSYQNATTIYAQPVSISNQFHELLLTKMKSVVLTSATLSTNGKFDYFINELGMDKSAETFIIASPFDYRNRVKVFIPKELPDIISVSLDDYVAAITEHIISIAEVTKGRILVLFTAHDMLRKTYTLIKESGFLSEYALIAQGISGGSRSRLTKNFQKFDKAILFGTSSFWEGVDIPGEALSCLIMVRLPFTSPDEPLMKAKCQEIMKMGGNGFQEVALPEAVLKFKQGFGRLIRSEEDRGVLIIFDRRVITTSYGKTFLTSIPSVPIFELKMDLILQQIYSWLPPR
ncbi:ATP-dependent DNA helicase DinG [Pseudoneobacillus sp. C159]